MSTASKPFARSLNDRMIAGVCSGIAKYFQIDATIVRLIFVAAALLGGPGILAYLVCLILMPLEPLVPPTAVVDVNEPPAEV